MGEEEKKEEREGRRERRKEGGRKEGRFTSKSEMCIASSRGS